MSDDEALRDGLCEIARTTPLSLREVTSLADMAKAFGASGDGVLAFTRTMIAADAESGGAAIPILRDHLAAQILRDSVDRQATQPEPILLTQPGGMNGRLSDD